MTEAEAWTEIKYECPKCHEIEEVGYEYFGTNYWAHWTCTNCGEKLKLIKEG